LIIHFFFVFFLSPFFSFSFSLFFFFWFFLLHIDQIEQDLLPENQSKIENQPIDFDLPGAGQHYCIECAKYFIDELSLKEHKKGKVHKRR